MKNNVKYMDKVAAVAVRLAPKYGVERMGVFGSLVRGKFGKNSDIDILVKFSKPVGFFELIGLENELGKRLGRKIDLVTENSLSPYFRDDVLQYVRVIYDKK